jgi:radical SAM superfamily enzyme YgiQ (UPF0313 family)
MKNDISILLINPWITDFAAYNLWAEPLGILYIASILKKVGARINYINNLVSIEEPNPNQKENGCSKYPRQIIPKPECLSFINRNFAVYGIKDDEFINRLRKAGEPDIVLVTSVMTYWYPGVFKTIKMVKKTFGPGIPLILGGIYSKLCPEHAKAGSGADYIYNHDDPVGLIKMIEQITGKYFSGSIKAASFADYPSPLHEIHKNRGFFSVLTRRGCPYSCSYCASGLLCGGFSERTVSSVVSEIKKYSKQSGAKNIAFYDDALLMDPEYHIIPILEKIIDNELGLFFHLPNGIHSSLMTKKIARLFYRAGIKTIRIGLETTDKMLQKKFGNKTTNTDYAHAVSLLREAGYSKKAIGTYVMAGLPSQTVKNVEESLDFVCRAGSSPYLSYFSPIPGTKIWPEAIHSTSYPIDTEPLFQNNTVFILGSKEFSGSSIKDLKDRAVGLRKEP